MKLVIENLTERELQSLHDLNAQLSQICATDGMAFQRKESMDKANDYGKRAMWFSSIMQKKKTNQ